MTDKENKRQVVTMNEKQNELVFPDNIVADRHEVTDKWVMWYLTDEQAKICSAALQAGNDPREQQIEILRSALEDITNKTAMNYWVKQAANCLSSIENHGVFADRVAKQALAQADKIAMGGV